VPRLNNVLRWLCGPHSFTSRRHFPGIKWGQREAGHVSPSSAEVNAWNFTCIAHVWMAWLLSLPVVYILPCFNQISRQCASRWIDNGYDTSFELTITHSYVCTFFEEQRQYAIRSVAYVTILITFSVLAQLRGWLTFYNCCWWALNAAGWC